MLDWETVFETHGSVVLARADLIGAGASGRMLTKAVRDGALVRARRDHYCLPGRRPTVRAVRVGGRLGCVSALGEYGVFVLDASGPHLHVGRRMTRLRTPQSRRRRLGKRNRDGAVLHWEALIDAGNAESHRVGLADALLQALRCQQPCFALASIDSALHQRLLTESDVADIFANAPQRTQRLRKLVDKRAESGQESVLRFFLIDAGLSFEIQVEIDGVGRVDFVIDGWLIVEADSELAHGGWTAQVRDRERDLAAAKQGFATIRPVYRHIMFAPETVLAAIRGLLDGRGV